MTRIPRKSDRELLERVQQKVQTLELELSKLSLIKTKADQYEISLASAQKDNDHLKAQLAMAESVIDKFSVRTSKVK